MCAVDARINTAAGIRFGQRRGVILHHPDPPIRIENDGSASTYKDRAVPDETLIGLWLDGRSVHTRRAYETDVRRLLVAIDKSIASINLGDLQGWAATLSGLAPASRARKIGAAKSLLAFGHRAG